MMLLEFKSRRLKRDVPVRVVLPFDRGGRPPYSCLVLLHGLQGNVNTWVYNTRVERWAQDRNLCVVMPQGDNSFWVEAGVPGGPVGDYGAFVAEELVETVRSLFPVAQGREGTFVGGFSMGGYGALRAGLSHPGTFSRILAFSPAIHFFEAGEGELSAHGDVAGERLLFRGGRGTDLDVRWLAQGLARAVGAGEASWPAVRMLVGEGDWLAGCNGAFAEALAALGAPVEFDAYPGIHSWNFVQDHLEGALDWVVGGCGPFAPGGSLD
ncbi:alpha/beta hydrolase [Caniella muris]|uniref:alpha/beta hydrolase n=1 Tax=Caniella muris TaxID=2941502 RepID=UPI00203B181E|nr:alpha/beta hydrolase-fold protein [Caniella muris]